MATPSSAACGNFFSTLAAMPQERVALACTRTGLLREANFRDKGAAKISMRLAFMHQKLWESSRELPWRERRRINRRLTNAFKFVVKAHAKAEEKFTHPRFLRDDKDVVEAVESVCMERYSTLLEEIRPSMPVLPLGKDVSVIHEVPRVRILNGEREVCFAIAARDSAALATACCARPVQASIQGFLCLECAKPVPWELAQDLPKRTTLEQALSSVAAYMGIDPLRQTMLQLEIENVWQTEYVDKVLDQILEDLETGAFNA